MQVSENVDRRERIPVLWVPETALVPDHAPEALHEVAFVEFQVKVEATPERTEAGLADRVTVGAVATGGADAPLPYPIWNA